MKSNKLSFLKNKKNIVFGLLIILLVLFLYVSIKKLNKSRVFEKVSFRFIFLPGSSYIYSWKGFSSYLDNRADSDLGLQDEDEQLKSMAKKIVTEFMDTFGQKTGKGFFDWTAAV